MIGFSGSFNTNYNPLTIPTPADVVPLTFVDLPCFLPALTFQSLTGMASCEVHDCRPNFCMCSCRCVLGKGGREGERRAGEHFSETKGLSCLTSGECRVVVPVALSLGLFVNALSLPLPALLVASLVARWLLYNVHSLIF